MSIRIGSADYDNLPGPVSTRKFDSLRYTIAGSADYIVASAIASAWKWNLLVSASATGWAGSGNSAGGLDSLRGSFGSATAVVIVSDEAVTATAAFQKLTPSKQLNPTMYEYAVEFTRLK
jgi:hypothetical protein